MKTQKKKKKKKKKKSNTLPPHRYTDMSKFKTGDTLIVMWQIDGYLSNTDLSELGRVAFPATSLAFRLPTPVPQEWITKGVKPKDKNELTITVSLASDSSVNSDQQVGGVFGEEPDFQYTCANGLTCNLGAVNCACATRQTCANNGVCVLNICTPPATPAPTVATNLPCTQSTPSALGACATDPSSLFSCQCVGSSGLAPCGGSQQGTCQRCTAGQPFCACTAGGTCATANFRCLGSRCFPNYACLNCPCQSGVCDTGLMCDAASQTCVTAGSTAPVCTPGGANCACKSGGICNDASLACISAMCRQCQDGLETCNCVNGSTCQGSLICNSSTKKCQRANCQEGTLNCPCTAAKTCSLSTLQCNGVLCVPEGQPFESTTSTRPPVTAAPACPLGNESCKCKSDGTCNGAQLKCINTFCQPSCVLGDEGCPCASLNGTPACTSPTLRCMTATTNTCEKTQSSSASIDTNGGGALRLVQAVTVVAATLVLAFA
jgi:hypothetical protein